MTYPDPQAEAFNVPSLNDDVAIKDFTMKQKRVKFRIDDDIFEASRVLGIPMMQDIVKLTKSMGTMSSTGDYSAVPEIFNELLLPASAERFIARLNSRGDDGIDVRTQLMPVLQYLMESFGLRPTQPSSDSSTGSLSEPDGISSTVGSSLEASTSQS